MWASQPRRKGHCGKERYMSVANRAESLREVDLFSDCSRKELQHIARKAEQVDFTAGDNIVEEGSGGAMAGYAFVIVHGTAVVRRNGRKVAEIGPGESIGEMALFDDGPRTASVVAATDMETIMLSRRELKGIIDSTPSVAHKLLSELAGRLRKANRKLYG
ncbi:MAG: cyclic nucleotide-binding domain-containing protein [Acidimicrobiaceae bacterium]|nr:cyclic nucleotide-binding domain-containing protein [Acidimicrobiaceae bacterium]MXX42434.1 cyclic nucleotide-binding domain-containing protein [Acidimicrobiales bacterium]MXY03688.1 cyclic nucleotide-binding domain-containing protein [Acidimicrobiales bacterium]MYA25057.1 cyclic nucleotide-binding domain-containing protein [Acidimicrobiales bacterium]MYA82209.1 cyclic nucleotide-binding domain-containing protein [Acidimicrobiales bacterium]